VAGLGLFLALVSFYHRLRPLIIQAGICVVLVSAVAVANRGSIWSPYYKIETSPQFLDTACDEASLGQHYRERATGKIPWGYTLSYNGVQFVAALDTSEEFIARHPAYKACRDIQVRHNEIAFKLFTPKDKKVLILASGPGNDVASALRLGAAHVDAVDIDPMPIALGTALHPEKPYSHPNVTTYVDDARTFLQRSTTKYDYVFFASIDSQVLLSGMSSIRLDNFIYTREAIHAAKARLSPDGILAIYYWGGGVKEWIPQRFERMLLDTFPEEQVYSDGSLYVAGTPVRAWKLSRLEKGLTADGSVDPRTVPTDDWPFLYLRNRHIPFVFVYMAGVLIGFSVLMAYGAQLRVRDVHYGFLFLGAGFLLLETKAVTQMALLYGSTWFVNTVVFSVILSVALLGNYFVTRFPAIKTEHLYLGLGAALLTNYFFNVGDLLEYAPIYRGPLSSLVLGAPFFFAAAIFAQKFSAVPRESLGAALGSNLIGTTMGGIVEYVSLVSGIQFLVLLALMFYGLAFVAALSEKRRWLPA
jgi:SAM-dependent methyltransferase